MELHVLASGSTGNAMLLKMGDTKLLIDAGISARRIKNALQTVNTAVEDIDGILITHEHRDHVNGLATLMKKYDIPAYARPDTWQAISCLKDLPGKQCCIIEDSIDINDVKIESFDISHDAVDPVGFCFFHRQQKYSVATDLGFVTDKVKKALALSDVLVLESNHDLDMLKQGSYPWYLKQRIMSNRGHLSNIDAGWALARLPKKDKMQVCLAHISKENNRPQLAQDTVSAIIEGAGLDRQQIELYLTYPDNTASITTDILE